MRRLKFYIVLVPCSSHIFRIKARQLDSCVRRCELPINFFGAAVAVISPGRDLSLHGCHLGDPAIEALSSAR